MRVFPIFLFPHLNSPSSFISLVPSLLTLKGFDEGTSEDLIDFNLPVGNVDEDSSDSLDGLPPIDSIEQSFFNMDPGLAIDSSLATESDIDDASLLLAESSQADYCSFSTSLVPDGLQISRRKTTCQDTGSSSGASGAGNALNVNPKVAPYLSLDNLGNMELNEICPPKSLINMYYVPVCSSPYKMNTRKSPYFPPYWKLFRAQLSRSTFGIKRPPLSLSIHLPNGDG